MELKNSIVFAYLSEKPIKKVLDTVGQVGKIGASKQRSEVHMGYLTKFELSTKGSIPSEEVEKALKGQCGLTLDDLEDSIRWYNHEHDLRDISHHYPDVLFILTGIGEEYGDFWHKYFKGGKMQKCKAVITYPPYDPDALT